MTRKRKNPQPGPKFIPCGRCMGGLLRIERGTGYVMVDCECIKAWKGIKEPEIVRKSRVCND